MTQNLKIEVVTENISESGVIVTSLVTKEELSQVVTKKADLGADGKIPTSQLPDNILNTTTIVDQVKTQLESTIQDGIQEANSYAESYVDDAVVKKADLGDDGKVPKAQLPSLSEYSEFKTSNDSIKNELTTAFKKRTDQLELSKASLDDNGKVLREQLPEFDQFPGVPELLDDLSTRTVQNIEHVIDQAVVEATVKSNAVAYEAATRAEAAAVSANIGNKVYSTPAEGVKAGTGVPVSSYFNVRSPRSEYYVDEYLNRNGVPEATGKSYPSAKGLQDAQASAGRSAAIAEAAATAATIGAGVFDTPEAGVAAGTGVSDGAYFNVRSSSDESYVDEYQNVGGAAVATGKSYQSTYGFETQDKSAATIKDSSGVSQQEINHYNVFPEFFGAVGGDAEKDTKAFKDAIAAGANLTLVSGKEYHLKCDAFSVGSGKNLVIYGNSNAKVVLYAGSSSESAVFDISNVNKVIVDSVNFSVEGTTNRRLFTVSAESYIKEFSITNNGFTGDAFLIRGYGSTTRNPITNPYGFKRFKVSGNVCTNVLGGFCVLQDYPIYYGEIDGNEVTNFKNVFFNFGLTNASANGASISKITELYCDHNLFQCEDDYWATGISGAYFTPIIAEGRHITWSNNRVFGMKTNENVSTYDAYLMCQNATRFGNIVKNIGSFHPSNDTNAIYHAKGDRLSGFTIPVKTIIGDQFTIEDEWLSRIGKTSIKHRMFNFGAENGGICILKNNVVNAHHLYASQGNRFEQFESHGNIINTKTCSGPLYNIGPAKESGCTVSIKGLTINIAEYDVEKGSGSFSLMRPINNNRVWDKLELDDITVNGESSEATTNSLLTGVRSKQSYISKTRYNMPLFAELYNCRLGELYGSDNIVKLTRSSFGASPNRYLFLNGDSIYKSLVTGFIGSMFFSVHSDKSMPPVRSSNLFSHKVKIETLTSEVNIEFNYLLNWDSVTQEYTVHFKDEDGVDVSATIASGDSGDSDGVYAQVNKTEGTPIRVRFRNSTLEDGIYFSVTGITTEHCRCTTEITVIN